MGVDASIYAKNAKKRYYFDRLYNIESYWDLNAPNHDELQDIYYRLRRNQDEEGCTITETLRLMDACETAWICNNPPEDHYHAQWIVGIKKFLALCGEDIYFVVTDHEQEWPAILDEYEEVEFI